MKGGGRRHYPAGRKCILLLTGICWYVLHSLFGYSFLLLNLLPGFLQFEDDFFSRVKLEAAGPKCRFSPILLSVKLEKIGLFSVSKSLEGGLFS